MKDTEVYIRRTCQVCGKKFDRNVYSYGRLECMSRYRSRRCCSKECNYKLRKNWGYKGI